MRKPPPRGGARVGDPKGALLGGALPGTLGRSPRNPSLATCASRIHGDGRLEDRLFPSGVAQPARRPSTRSVFILTVFELLVGALPPPSGSRTASLHPVWDNSSRC